MEHQGRDVVDIGLRGLLSYCTVGLSLRHAGRRQSLLSSTTCPSLYHAPRNIIKYWFWGQRMIHYSEKPWKNRSLLHKYSNIATIAENVTTNRRVSQVFRSTKMVRMCSICFAECHRPDSCNHMSASGAHTDGIARCISNGCAEYVTSGVIHRLVNNTASVSTAGMEYCTVQQNGIWYLPGCACSGLL